MGEAGVEARRRARQRPSSGWRGQRGGRHAVAGSLPPLALTVVVGVLALFPLVGERAFYYWDDTAAAFAPTWHAIGLDLLAGTWPTLRPELWMGGNWAAEAQFGLWNPVNLAGAVFVALIPDLALAVTLVKVAVMELLALGGYALMREYGARPWPSVGVASALPFAGFTLFFDTTTWVAGLIAFAWTPWFWWAARRTARGAANPVLMYAVGYLALTNGNPYGTIAAVFVLVGLAVESWLLRNLVGLARLVVAGACVGTAAGVAYLPMFLTARAGWRGDAASFGHTGELVPNLSMLAATSSPSLLPTVDMWGQFGSTVPIAYTAWFLLPLVPWLRWGVVRTHVREMAGLLVVGAIFLMVALGPSEMWLFRWPVRLLQYVFLPVGVLLAVLASHGLRTDAWRWRLGASLAVVLAGGWLAVAANPEVLLRHGIATALVLALAATLAWAARYPRVLPVVLVGGTSLVVASQLAWTPRNMDVAPWYFPTRVAQFEAYGERHEGPLIQVAAESLVPAEERPAAWTDLLFGSTPAVAGVESTVSYTGIGFTSFSRTLCLNHFGGSCAAALPNVWAPAGTAVPVAHFADAVKARTVVVQNALVADALVAVGSGARAGVVAEAGVVPPGWELQTSERVTVFRRRGEIPWPESRLAAATNGVQIEAAEGTRTTERLRVSTPASGGAVQFARLAWPGYSAMVGGSPVAVHENDQGLIEVTLPGGLTGAEVHLDFTPPGYQIAIPVAVVGLVGALAQGLWWHRTRRNFGRDPAGTTSRQSVLQSITPPAL